MRARILTAWLAIQADRLRVQYHRGIRYRAFWIGSFFVLAALLSGCATAPAPSGYVADAGDVVAVDPCTVPLLFTVEERRVFCVHEVAR